MLSRHWPRGESLRHVSLRAEDGLCSLRASRKPAGDSEKISDDDAPCRLATITSLPQPSIDKDDTVSACNVSSQFCSLDSEARLHLPTRSSADPADALAAYEGPVQAVRHDVAVRQPRATCGYIAYSSATLRCPISSLIAAYGQAASTSLWSYG